MDFWDRMTERERNILLFGAYAGKATTWGILGMVFHPYFLAATAFFALLAYQNYRKVW